MENTEAQETVVPTPELKFIGGRLHQLCLVTVGNTTGPQWREVPSEEAADPAA